MTSRRNLHLLDRQVNVRARVWSAQSPDTAGSVFRHMLVVQTRDYRSAQQQTIGSPAARRVASNGSIPDPQPSQDARGRSTFVDNNNQLGRFLVQLHVCGISRHRPPAALNLPARPRSASPPKVGVYNYQRCCPGNHSI